MQQACIAIIIILLTVAAYLAMVKLYKRFPLPFLIPVLTTTILIVAVLMMFHVSYEGYMIGEMDQFFAWAGCRGTGLSAL